MSQPAPPHPDASSRTPQRAIDSPEGKRARKFAIAATILSALTLVALYFLQLPLKATGVLTAMGAVVLFIITLITARGVAFGALFRIGVSLLIACNLLLMVVLGAWSAMFIYTAPYEQCVAQALTDSSREACTTELMDKLNKLSGVTRP
ncbi:hypothetical protein [Haematomicrobium sanguinis]|uniref:hypothetical protein n=1 Tax=Haematomicrobium sanguinis TaxID=479106 RepID=UPI00047B4820|nr:hypothetical protein [Haematomicrobium sanguinis]